MINVYDQWNHVNICKYINKIPNIKTLTHKIINQANKKTGPTILPAPGYISKEEIKKR